MVGDAWWKERVMIKRIFQPVLGQEGRFAYKCRETRQKWGRIALAFHSGLVLRHLAILRQIKLYMCLSHFSDEVWFSEPFPALNMVIWVLFYSIYLEISAKKRDFCSFFRFSYSVRECSRVKLAWKPFLNIAGYLVKISRSASMRKYWFEASKNGHFFNFIR